MHYNSNLARISLYVEISRRRKAGDVLNDVWGAGMNRSEVRRNVYKMLCGIVSYPDDRFYSVARDGQLQKELQQSLNFLDEGYFSGCLEDFQCACATETVESQAEMADEYERLFGGLCRFSDDTESMAFIRGIWRCLEEQKCEDAAFNDQFGRVFQKTAWPSADSLRNRFVLMGIFAERESNAACSERIHLEEMQIDFTSRFISGSVREFCESLVSDSLVDFYRAAGILIREFVAFEESYLGIPDEIDTS